MIDFSLRYFLKTSDQITNQELTEIFEDANDFIENFTPIVQRLSLTKT